MNATNTTTLNATNNGYTMAVTVAIGIAMTLLSFLIVFGNILVIFVYVRNKSLQTPKNYFILSLAIADVLIGIFSVNFYTLYLITGYWPLGEVLCDLWLSMDYSCCQASTLGLLAISVDRLLSIQNAVFYRNNFTKDRLKKIILGLWVTSFLIWFGSVFLYPVIYGERTVNKRECHIQFLYENPTVTIITAFVNFYGPIIVMTIIYICVSMTLIRRYKDLTKKSYSKEALQCSESLSSVSFRPYIVADCSSIFAHKPFNEKQIPDKDSDGQEIKAQYNSSRENVNLLVGSSINRLAVPFIDLTPSGSPILPRSKQNNNKRRLTETRKQYMAHKRAVTLLLLVILAFAVTWVPYNLMAVIWPFCRSCIKTPWWHFGYIFCYVNSLLNPFCYAFGNRNFKKCFKKVFQDLKKTFETLLS